MTPALVIGIALLGGVGAVGRFALDSVISARAKGRFPFGILAVNLSGALLLGVLVGAALSDHPYKLFGTGLIGAYTTFSTWMFQSYALNEDGDQPAAWLNIVGSLVLGVLAAWVGRQLGSAL